MFILFLLIAVGMILVLWPSAHRFQAWQSGWTELARKYRHDEPFEGRTWSGLTAGLGTTAYERGDFTFEIGGDERGLYMRQGFPKLRHPPLLIPWSDIQIPEKRWTSWGSATLLLGPQKRPLTLTGNITKEFMDHMLGLHARSSGATTRPSRGVQSAPS